MTPNFKLCDKNDFSSNLYLQMYAQSLLDPNTFWKEHGKRVSWITPFTVTNNSTFSKAHVSIKWFEDGELNVCYNCLDRHLPMRGNKIAFMWEGDSPKDTHQITYYDLHLMVCKFANVLKSKGIKKGDRVIIYLPMRIEAAAAMLACSRIGAIHSVVFGGFSSESLASRIADCEPKAIITIDVAHRSGKILNFKNHVTEAFGLLPHIPVESVLVFKQDPSTHLHKNECDLQKLLDKASSECAYETMAAEDPLFILYTSGSTGKPKGVVHTTGGYLVYASMTHEYIFNLREDDIYWCTADIGWITGHTYVVYGPLCNGSTSVMFEGVPNYPDYSRYWQIIDRYKVSVFYTAPTVIRSLKSQGLKHLSTTTRKSLRIMGSVGEPIDQPTWQWYHDYVGNKQAFVTDTWWQTETGGILMAPLRGMTPMKAGFVTYPFFGVKPNLISQHQSPIQGEGSGHLIIENSWPGQARTLFRDHNKFIETYFTTHNGYYFTGDGAERDRNGFYRITGRVDDVLNVSGHRLGTAELENALIRHQDVVEAAVVGYPHDIKGQGIYAYIVLYDDQKASDELKKEIVSHVRTVIGPVATIDKIQWTTGLPKTRSGKVMRRILRKIAENEISHLGDISTLSDPSIVETLIKNRL